MKIYFWGLFLNIFAFPLVSQNVGTGLSVMYNFQTESFGMGARANFFPDNRIRFVPQLYYYPSFNKVEEYIVGLGMEYPFLKTNNVHFYALAYGAYNAWLNYQVSEKKGAKKNNWNGEIGIGISTNACWRPFAEFRYNFKFLETHLQAGILYVFGCKGKNKDSAVQCTTF